MPRKWTYVAAVAVLAAVAGGAALYYYGFGQAQTVPVTIHVAGMVTDGAVPIPGVHVTAAFEGQTLTAVTDDFGQAVFHIPQNMHVIITDELSGYKAIDVGASGMYVPLFHSQ